MMFNVKRFDVEHIKPLLNEKINSGLSHLAANDYQLSKHLGETTLGITVCVGDEVVMCSFIVEIWKGRGYAVVILSEKIKDHPVIVYRGIRKNIERLPFSRIEFDSPCDFELGHRRAKFLGFDLMCEKARRYLPNGGEAAVYEWVRP